MKTFDFKHEEQDIFSACGLSKDTLIRTREKILFSIFSNAIKSLKMQIEDDYSSNPTCNSVSATLERALTLFDIEAERNLALLMFLRLNDTCKQLCQLFIPFLVKEAPEKIRRNIMEKLEESHKELHKTLMEDEDIANDAENIVHKMAISPLNLFKRFQMILDSNESFDVYMSKYIKAEFEPMFSDIDKMLDNVFDFN